MLLKFGAINVEPPLGTDVFFYVGEYNPGLRRLGTGPARTGCQHLSCRRSAIVLAQIAFYSRYQRNAMLDVLGSDFLRTAQAKGLRRRTALIKHGLRTALIPMATFFAYSFGLLLTGATFTEKIFGWHGMGEWFIDSDQQERRQRRWRRSIVFSAVLVLIAGLLADVLHAALDPRVRIR